MTQEEIVKEFLEDVYTKDQALEKFDLLEKFLVDKFFSSSSPQLPSSLKGLSDEFYNYFTREEVYQKLSSLEKTLNRLKPLIIYLAFDPPQREIRELGRFIKDRMDKDIILEIRKNPSLVAGCALVWKGRYRDFSLRKIFQEKNDKILDIFSRYLNQG